MSAFWIIGLMFTVGLAWAEITEDGFDMGALVFIVASIFLWPLFLGMAIYDMVKPFNDLAKRNLGTLKTDK